MLSTDKLKNKEVINISDGRSLGFVSDIEVNRGNHHSRRAWAVRMVSQGRGGQDDPLGERADGRGRCDPGGNRADAALKKVERGAQIW